MSSPKLLTRVFLFGLILTGVLHWASVVNAYDNTYALGADYQVSSKYLVLGDRIDVTMKALLLDDKPMTQDRKGRLSIRNPKPGQKCETTDDSFKDDGMIKGWCEAKGDAGNMEIAISMDGTDAINMDGKSYYAFIYKTYNAMFNDPNQTCKDANTPPSGVTITKQNDVTIDVKWTHVDKFVGNYEVLYGTTLGEFSNSKKTEEHSVVVDQINPSKTYYIKVQAKSACKTTTSSPTYAYNPATGGVSAATEKPKATATPTPSASPTLKPKVSPLPKPTVSPTASIAASPTASSSALPARTPLPSSTPQITSNDVAPGKKLPLPIVIGGAVSVVGIFSAAAFAFWKMRLRKSM